jgi:hypothetical protein
VADHRNNNNRKPKKSPILGHSHGLSDIEGEMIQQMIRDEQNSDRELYIPTEDLAEEATTCMTPAVAKVIEDSRVQIILQMFNRDYLYGQGRFDEYKDGLILKWGDGYSRKHIWASVENGDLLFEVSHYKQCEKPYCNGTHHVLSRELFTNMDVINQELGDLFQRPVYEPPDD